MFYRVLVASLFVVWGLSCGGGGGGGAPSYSALKQKFNNPTGQLKKDNVNQVGQAFADAEKKGQGISMTAGALDEIESKASEDPISCPTNGGTSFTCTCNGGGSLNISVGSYSAESVSVAYTYDQCGINSDNCTVVYNGSGYTVSSQSEQGYFISYQGTVKDCDGQTVSVDFSYYYDGSGKIWVLVEVGGETFVVSGYWSEESYDFYVKDKDGEWHCQGTSAGGSCTGPGGQTINL